ncbi:unnamed protein product [Rotaria magnacalcarata]|uniref:Glyoxylate reductase/hydroxypyruvate reductase n=1 Tax=Rotaria magnacalcarata TaxID=392030 RepID=A0A815MR27_9BILA|nr:unnamed protein product [Rotaria magnacalcarata]CAF1428273.1 unnamed protein product [Rotaria magnacalcarata]CAF1981944.1 unnamed protein product [Rotaria magnacalcarata]CAF2169937.1 unnamed protein product [Rotaria magnacalcarata]
MASTIRPRLFITQQMPSQFIHALERVFELDYQDTPTPLSPEQILFRIRAHPPDAILFTSKIKIDKELLSVVGDKLKMLATFSVGYDHIDVKECQKRGIPIGYTPGVLTDATADLAMALLLATARRITQAVRAVRNGEWGTSCDVMWMCGKPLTNATVGIVGLGRIGLAIARRLQPFSIQRALYSGTREKYFDSNADKTFFKYVPFTELLGESDFVIIACELNEHTKNMFNKNAFEQMKNDAILINIARGGIIDQDALYDALTNGFIGAAGLDVTVPEPLPKEHRLLTLENCTIFPHIGSADVSARHQMAQICVDNLFNFFSGKPMVHQLKLGDA